MQIEAINDIYSALSNRQLEFVEDLETTRELILKLDPLYLRESTVLQILQHPATTLNWKITLTESHLSLLSK